MDTETTVIPAKEIPKIVFEDKIHEFKSFYDENLEILNSAASVFRTLLNALVVDFPIESITSRIKEKGECIGKFERKYLSEAEKDGKDYKIEKYITDLIGLRIVCLYNDDIAKVQKVIESNFTEIDITDKTRLMESTEDKFGYKGLHLDLKLNDQRSSLPEYVKFKDLRFELQIRTIIQDAWSVLDHKIKYKKNIPLDLKRRINRLSALFEIADEEFLKIKTDSLNEQQKAKEEIADPKPVEEVLDVFKFLSIAEVSFPKYNFIEYKADGFLSEILEIDEKYTTNKLLKALDDGIKVVLQYAHNSPLNTMNPYTIIRHCLYLSDRGKFKGLLYDFQREQFEIWLDKQDSLK